MLIMPAFTHTNLLATYFAAAKAAKLLRIFCVADLLIVMESVGIYQISKRVVRSLVYRPMQGTLLLTHHQNRWLVETTEEFRPEDIVRHKGKSLNPLIGYKIPREVGDDYFLATEGGICDWHERKLFDSIIRQPKKRPSD